MAPLTWGNPINAAVGESSAASLSALLNQRKRVVDLRDWGAIDLTGTNDNATQLQAAITQAATAGWPLQLPSGIIAVASSLTVSQQGATIRGAGRRLTRIKFVPTGHDARCFDVATANPSADQLNDFSISDLGIYSTDTTYRKRALRLRNCSKFSIERVDVWGATFGGSWMYGGDTAGFEIAGREQGNVRNCRIYAAVPLYLSENPSEVGGSYDTDHFNFHNLTLSTDSTAGAGLSSLQHACVMIGDDVRMSPLSFTGYQAWVRGKYGLYWDNSSSAQASSQLYIENLLTEQGVDLTNGWSIYIIGGSSEGTGLGSLTLVNCQPESPRPAIKTRYVDHVAILGGRYAQTTKTIAEIQNGRTFSARGWQTVATAKESLIRFPDGDYHFSSGVPNYGSTAYIPSEGVWQRSGSASSTAATTLTTAAVATDTVLTVASIADTDFQDDAPVKVQLDSGRWHVTTIDGAPSSSQITLKTAIPTGEAAAIGNQVITNRVMSTAKADYRIGDGDVMVRRIALDTNQTYRLPLNSGTMNVEQCILEVQAFDPTNNVLAWGTYALTAAAIGTNGISLRAGSNAVVGSSPSSGEIGVYAEAATLGADIRVKSNLAAEAKFLIVATSIRTLQS